MEKIVLGLPLNMDESVSERSKLCLEFKDKIERRTGIPVEMLDERLNMAGMERYLAIIADNSSKGIYLEDGTLVGHLLPAIDSGLAKYSMRGGRGNR